MIVVDTNIVAYLMIEGDRTDAARRVWQRDAQWRLPPLWRAEFLNVLATTIRAHLLERSQAEDAWLNATAILGRNELSPPGTAVLRLAATHRISAYDAQFVAVARAVEAPLVTADRALCKACPDDTISLETFAHGL